MTDFSDTTKRLTIWGTQVVNASMEGMLNNSVSIGWIDNVAMLVFRGSDEKVMEDLSNVLLENNVALQFLTKSLYLTMRKIEAQKHQKDHPSELSDMTFEDMMDFINKHRQ